MENSVLISVNTAERLAKRVPRAMGTVVIRRVYKRFAHQGYSLVVNGKPLNERAMSLLSD